MWRAKRVMLHLVIGARNIQAALSVGGDWRLESVKSFALDPGNVSGAGLTEALLALQDGLKQDLPAPGLDGVFVLIDDVWVMEAVLPWAGGMLSDGKGEQYAQKALFEQGSVLEQGRVRVDDAPWQSPRLAVSYPAFLMRDLQALSQRFNSPLRSVLPLSTAAWSICAEQSATGGKSIGIAGDGWFCIMSGQRRVEQIQVRRVAHGDESLELLKHWKRWSLRNPSLVQEHPDHWLQLVPESAKAQHSPKGSALVEWPAGVRVSPSLNLSHMSMSRALSLDAIAQRSMTPRRRAGLLLAAVCVLGLVGWVASVSQRISERSGELEAFQRPVPIEEPVREWSKEDFERLKAVNFAIRSLNFPINSLLQAIQAEAGVRVVILSADLSSAAKGKRRSIRLDAEAASAADMAAYVEHLALRKPFSAAYLLRHEQVASGGLRFSVEAIWTD